MDVDPETFRARRALPQCPRCGALARPNILMFGDWDWDGSLASQQEARLAEWESQVRLGGARLVIVELGAGTGVPTVRMNGEQRVRSLGATLIRINVREPEVPREHIGIAQGALAALTAIDGLLQGG